jgi:predicted Fe-Mo cluster-binding NifX family protein
MSDQPLTQERIIAVPSMSPGGLEAQRSGHFGQCDFFTLVKVNDGVAAEVTVVNNAPHQEGGCLEPVKLLSSLGATEIVVAGMGARPLAFFEELGIKVYVDQERSVVGEAIDALLAGDLSRMSAMHACGGGSCH